MLYIVYDASTRADNQSKSSNGYLEPGPNLQNQIWKILVRTSFNPVAICGDLKQAFLQIRIQETCRDAVRFHWIKDRNPQKKLKYTDSQDWCLDLPNHSLY